MSVFGGSRRSEGDGGGERAASWSVGRRGEGGERGSLELLRDEVGKNDGLLDDAEEAWLLPSTPIEEVRCTGE